MSRFAQAGLVATLHETLRNSLMLHAYRHQPESQGDLATF